MEIASNSKPIGPGPKTRVCYICGRQYGVHSYEIHLKQCKELWIAREALKEPKDRKKLPEDPALRLLSKEGGAETSTPIGASSRPTSSGPRNQPGPSKSDLDELNKLASEAFNTESLAQCTYCGRTFLPEKLAIHNRSCTADKPARKVTDSVRRGLAIPDVQPSEPNNSGQRPHTTSSVGRPKKSVDFKTPLATEAPSDDATNLKLNDGHLVGHLGGSSGRSIRQNNAQQSPKAGSTTKEDTMRIITNKIEVMETTIFTLIDSLNDLKTALRSLQNS